MDTAENRALEVAPSGSLTRAELANRLDVPPFQTEFVQFFTDSCFAVCLRKVFQISELVRLSPSGKRFFSIGSSAIE